MNNGGKHIAMRLVNQNRLSRLNRMATLLGAAFLLFIAAAPRASATVWTRNQTYQCGGISGPTNSNDDSPSGGNCSQPLWPGMPIRIVHGVKDINGNSTPVTVKITLPVTDFIVTKVDLWTFPGSGGAAIKSLNPPPASSLGNFVIGPLAAANDKVIVVIEGYFLHAGNYSIPFEADRPASGSSPAVTEGPPTQPSVLNINVQNTTSTIDVSVTKVVKDSTGAFGSTATWPFGTTVSYKITVKNLSGTDLYLGGILNLTDTITTPNSNGVAIDITPTYYPCTSSAGADCMAQPSSSSLITWNQGSFNLFQITYPAGSYGFLPANGWIEIKFDLLLGTKETCYHTSQTNQLDNTASISFPGGISDQVASNNTSKATVTLTGGPSTPCPPPVLIAGTKTITSPTPTSGSPYPWGLFTYEIKFTTPATALTNFKLSDSVYGTGVPPFTATFAASNVTCSPASACPAGSITPNNAALLVNNYNTSLFSINFAALPVNTPVTITYQVKYDAPCADAATNGSITNTASLGGTTSSGTLSVNVSGGMSVTANMDKLPICPMQVTKTQTPVVASFASYPQTLNYHVRFQNPSPTQTVTFGTVLDTIALDSSQYGNLPMQYSYSNCTSSNVTPAPPASGGPTTTSAQNYPSVYVGTGLLNFPNTTFGPNGYIDCDVSVELSAPPTNDSLCQGEVPGRPPPHIVNVAYVNLLPNNYNEPTQPSWYQKVTTQLPYCVSLKVDKTTPSTAVPGGPITFNLSVKNTGNDPILAPVILTDSVPSWANAGSWHWQCISGCTGSGVGSLNLPLTSPFPAGAIATVTITGTAPDALGSFCNDDHAEIQPFPALTYFEGVDDLKNGEACVDVKPDENGTPTPTPTPTPGGGGTSGCAAVSDKDVHCIPNGGYSYTLGIANNSGSAMSQVLLTPLSGSTFGLSSQLANLSSPLPSGQSTTVTTIISNAQPGDKVCFFVSLLADGVPCCITQVCTTLPQCGTSPTPTVTPTPGPLPQLRPGKKRR